MNNPQFAKEATSHVRETINKDKKLTKCSRSCCSITHNICTLRIQPQ